MGLTYAINLLLSDIEKLKHINLLKDYLAKKEAEIEEIKELHPDDRHACQRAVAERRERAERQHDDADDGRGLLPAPAELVLEGRDGAFCQRDRAGQRGEEHEDEEQNADGRAEAHGVEDLGDGDEQQ